MADELKFPNWDTTNPSDSTTNLYNYAIQRAESESKWYHDKRGIKRRGSRLMRGLAIILGTLAAIFPLMAGVMENMRLQLALTQLGYVSVALAAALVAGDRLFGLSSGWMRYITTEFSLQRLLLEFQYDWMTLTAQQATPSDYLSRIARVRQFSLAIADTVQVETNAWVQEFQSNVTELEKTLKDQLETRKAELQQAVAAKAETEKAAEEAMKNGAVKITVSNARDFESVSILLNDEAKKELVNVTKGLIPNVEPGEYEIRAEGIKDGKTVSEVDIIEAEAGKTVSVDMTLPSP